MFVYETANYVPFIIRPNCVLTIIIITIINKRIKKKLTGERLLSNSCCICVK